MVDRPIDVWRSAEIEQLWNAGTVDADELSAGIVASVSKDRDGEPGLIDPTSITLQWS